jgi:hypothetical protein
MTLEERRGPHLISFKPYTALLNYYNQTSYNRTIFIIQSPFQSANQLAVLVPL